MPNEEIIDPFGQRRFEVEYKDSFIEELTTSGEVLGSDYGDIVIYGGGNSLPHFQMTSDCFEELGEPLKIMVNVAAVRG